MIPDGENKAQKHIQTLNLLDNDNTNELVVGQSSNYSYQKDQLARHTSFHKQVHEMNQTLNKILPHKSSKLIDM